MVFKRAFQNRSVLFANSGLGEHDIEKVFQYLGVMLPRVETLISKNNIRARLL